MIWYHLDDMYSLKNVKNAHGEVSLLRKMQAEAWLSGFEKAYANFFKINANFSSPQSFVNIDNKCLFQFNTEKLKLKILKSVKNLEQKCNLTELLHF